MPVEAWILSGAALVAAAVWHAGAGMAGGHGRKRILMVGMSPLAEQIIRSTSHSRRTRVMGIVDDAPRPAAAGDGPPVLGTLDRLSEIVEREQPHQVVVALREWRRHAPLSALLESCVVRGIPVEDAAQFYERLTGRLPLEALRPASLVLSGQFRPLPLHRAFARALSIVVALAGLACSLPLLAIIAMAIKLDSRGPVLFVQPRVGLNGRPFALMKFRTMRVTDAPPATEWAADNQSRITRVGRWLRTLRLDELPQLFNILRGEMNFVGPRPHPVRNRELFTLVARNLNDTTGARVSYYDLRSLVRPGLTGWAQVRYRYANDLDEEIEKLTYDLYYVKHASIRLDLRILLDTWRLVFSGRLADGVRRPARPAVRLRLPALRLLKTLAPPRGSALIHGLPNRASVPRDA